MAADRRRRWLDAAELGESAGCASTPDLPADSAWSLFARPRNSQLPGLRGRDQAVSLDRAGAARPMQLHGAGRASTAGEIAPIGRLLIAREAGD
jgi:hypothetical protein